MILSTKIKSEIKNDCLKDLGRERCGLIINFDDSNHILPCRNIAKNNSDFDISPSDYVYADSLGKILAVYHSHIDNPDFTQLDIQTVNLHKIPLVLYCLKNSEFKIAFPDEFKLPYVGREFEYGKQDCFSLITDYYSRELNINLINYFEQRNINIFKDNPELLNETDLQQKCWENNLKCYKFYSTGDLKKDDILLMLGFVGQRISHFGIYIGDSQVLHQPRSSVSKIEEIDKLINKIRYYVRRES